MIFKFKFKMIILLSIIAVVICSCGNENADSTTSFLIKDLRFGDDRADVDSKLNKLGISVENSSMDGGEILVFLQNNSISLDLDELIIDYVSSGKFSPEYPISSILPDIGIYNLRLPSHVGGSKINSRWSPSELYFYKNKFFAMSSLVPSDDDKKNLIEFHSKNRKDISPDPAGNSENEPSSSIELNDVYENDDAYMNINLAGNLYLYDKSVYKDVTLYIKKQLKSVLDQ